MTTSIKFRALTDEDHKLFFEALGEHGKDFQNIQQYMAQKGGQKSNNKSGDNNKSIEPQEKRESDKKEDDRKREQIRNFYNKLYTKLSQLIGKLDDRVEKVNQELYLLINYGEIWKRHGFKFNSKTKRLLEELIYQGTTTFRFKKKNVRLRTPPCKALKKINESGIDEKVKVVTTRELPKDVIVEFRPATNRDWLKVQSISQNPRVRARLSIQKRLSSILEFMESKWNISQDKLNRTVDVWLKITPSNTDHSSECIPSNFTNNNIDVHCLNTQTDQQTVSQQTFNGVEKHNECSPLDTIHQRIRLKPSCHHELKEINITRVVPDNHLDLSLNAYFKRFDITDPKRSEPPTRAQPTREAGNMVEQQPQRDNNIPLEFIGEATSTSCSILNDFQIPKNMVLGDYFKATGALNDGADDIANDAFPIHVETSSKKDDESKQVVSEEQLQGVSTKETKLQDHAIEIKKFVEGWTRQDDTSTTLGELYLAFKCPEKIILEYEFEPFTNSNLENNNTLAVQGAPYDSTYMFKLLTAASLSLAHIEKHKQEQQHKLHEQQSCSKFKRRKMSGQSQSMTSHDIEATNQRVEEALKLLQPTRLSSCRKARFV